MDLATFRKAICAYQCAPTSGSQEPFSFECTCDAQPYDETNEWVYERAVKDRDGISIYALLCEWAMARELWNRRMIPSALHTLVEAVSKGTSELRHLGLWQFNPALAVGGKDDRPQLGGVVAKNYDTLRKAIGPTCASKTLHAIVPDLFPPWDGTMRTSYGSDGQAYVNYMMDARDVIVPLVREAGDIARLASMFYDQAKALPKLFDEYWWTATRGYFQAHP